MRLPKSVLFFVLFLSVLAIPAHAQRGGHGGGHAGGGGHPGGAGYSGGGGYSGDHHGGGSRGYYGGHYYGGYYGGRYGYYGSRYYWPNVYFGFGFGYPYYGSYPFYYGSYPFYYRYPYYSYGHPYYYGTGAYYYGYVPYAYNSYPGYSAPSVSIQSNSGNPIARSQPQQLQPASSNGQKQNYYLIAFTNHVIEAATSYKMEGDQVHWITRESQQKQAPLSTVDVLFSRQVNGDRGIDLQIP